MDKLMKQFTKRPDTDQAANDRRSGRNCSKPKVIRKFNVSWEKNRSCYFLNTGECINNYINLLYIILNST